MSIKERLNKTASIGFQADLKDKYDGDKNLLSQVTLEDLRTFGMVPEFLGRLPIVFTLESLNEDMLVEILKEPKNAILKQYKRLLELDEVKLEFDDDALRSIARKALEKDAVEFFATCQITKEKAQDVLDQLNNDWDGEVDDCIAYGFNTKMFDSLVYHLNFQLYD